MKKIIIAPLNWGLGHATRCIPLINALLKNDFIPVIASDGKALQFLQQEFPKLETLKLPSYNISYKKNIKLNLILQTPKILKAIQKEKKVIADYLLKNSQVVGIISDNRFGVRNTKITSVYITHQLNVLSGFTTFITSNIHQKIIKKFDECWIPDNEKSEFSGKLSTITNHTIKTKFIGVLSRFNHKKIPHDIDILVLVSGVEPNRTLFEKKVKTTLLHSTKNIVLVCGKIEKTQKIHTEKNITIYNFALSKELENLINRAKIVICRSGYSSIMDLAVLQKKAIFIPTKHQSEQEYLATYVSEKKGVIFSSEEKFSLKTLENSENFKGLSSKKTTLNKELFSLFKRK